MRTRLTEELDYRTEARHQQAFVDGYRDDPEVVVPDVVTATGRVLVTTWLDGTPLAAVADWPDPARRAAVALRYQRFLLSGPARVGWLHSDPHPGNFRVVPDGRLGVLDFGSALRMPEGLPRSFGVLIASLGSDDPDAVTAALRAAGIVRPGATLDAPALMAVLAPFSEPARYERFHYHRAWLASTFGGLADPRDPDFATALQLTLPAEQLFTHRVWLGIVGVLCSLDVEMPVRAELRRWLPGFAP
jgi:predicted unusual protein kinase regulating ubiquinone biosynthesis (AarF/ABC1/UbiB family)